MTSAAPVQRALSTPPFADVLLVTVTDVETRAVFAALQATTGHTPTPHHLADHRSYDLGLIAGARVWLVRSEMGTMTPGGALATIGHALDALQPTAVIMLSSAFGMDPTAQRIGDVLVAKQLMLYDLQAVKTGRAGCSASCHAAIARHLPPSCSRACGMGRLVGTAPRVTVGLLRSGDKLIDHQGFRAQLRQIEPEALGGEMEGTGLYFAASQRKVDWILIKAICDWADGTKDDAHPQRQRLAADNAAAFTLHVLQQGGFARTARCPLPDDTAAIRAQLQTVLLSTPAPFHATVTRMVEDYTAIFGGRDAELAVLDQWLGADARPFAFLHAPTGRGKTALLIHWVGHVPARKGWTVVFVPISLRYQTATESSVRGALGVALAAFHQDKDFTTYNQSPDQLRPLIADELRRTPPAGQRLLLVLDGLDEAIGWRVGRELFPRVPGPHLRILASAREQASTTRANWAMQLGWATPHTCGLDLRGRTQAAVSDVLRRMGNPLNHLATDVDVLTEIARVRGGDPLTIRFLVEALHDGTLTPGRLVGLTEGFAAYVKDWLLELRRHRHQTEAVYALLAVCAVALGPLTTADLAALYPEQFQRNVDGRAAAATVARFLIGDGSAAQGYVLSHPRLRTLFGAREVLPQERAAVQARFVWYGRTWSAACRAPLPDYRRLFWVQHLRAVGAWILVRQVLTEVVPSGTGWTQPWATARYAAEGSDVGYLSDLDVLWQQCKQQGTICEAVRCALPMHAP